MTTAKVESTASAFLKKNGLQLKETIDDIAGLKAPELIEKKRLKQLSGQTGKPVTNDVRYIWTKNPTLLKQYLEIRREVLYSPYFTEDINLGLNPNDLRSHILLAVKDNNEVIGGVGICANDPILGIQLPSESAQFNYKSLLKHHDLDNHRYAEVTRLAFKKKYAKARYTIEVYKHIVEKCLTLGLSHVYITATMSRMRHYKHIFEHESRVEFELHENIKVPHDPAFKDNVELFLASFNKLRV